MTSNGLSVTSVGTGVQDNYFNVDDILSTQERILCTFETTILNMGYLDPGSETPHIQAGARLELPLWLTRAIAGGGRRKRTTARIELPRQYRDGYREILLADAGVVNLHRLGPYYYMFGSRLIRNFELPESADIARSLLKAFQSRLRRIMDGCQNALETESTSQIDTLDQSERAIFKNGQSGLSLFLRWETRQMEKLMASSMVSNMKKRKRVQMEDERRVSIQRTN